MRNLQKILALALALIMSFSLVVTANAAFSDEADITDTYNEAVNVLSQLEVFKGYTDGTYQPQKSITRAEVAAIIYRIATGDVTDTQVSIYSDWNRFTDVHAGEWWAGYINYCANAEYIKGYGNGKFGPDDPVTGYEALAMILRAVGYGKMDGEFQGSDWAVQTAARANTLKVTKNVQNSALLNSAATRELVAELLFRSILVPTVEYNQFSGYSENDTTLAYQSFGLEAIEGVVVANEYANLYDTEVLADGKTDMEEADGTVRHLDIGSALTDVGESRYAYIIDDSRGAKVLALEDTGSNNVFDNTTGEDRDVSTAKKFRDVSGIDLVEGENGTEFYVNFGREGHFSCDQRLEFEVIFYTKEAFDTFVSKYEKIGAYAYAGNQTPSKDDDWTIEAGTWKNTDGKPDRNETNRTITDGSAYVFPTNEIADGTDGNYILFNRIIRANEEITNEEMNIIEGIFAAADEIAINGQKQDMLSGDVYVGTKSNNDVNKEERDLSNSISFRKFKDEYINSEAWDRNFNNTGNGEWLKIVDNNNDGKAEYAFKTEYFLDEVVRVSTKNDETKYQYRYLDVDDVTVKYLTEEKLEVGSEVLYTLIDGKALVELPQVVTDEITSMSFKDETVTTKGGETYGQSDIYNKTTMDEIITNMDEGVKYNMYLDKYGFVRAYELADGNQYGLLTELYAGTYKNGRFVKNTDLTVELKAGDEKIEEFNVINNSGNDFDMRRAGLFKNKDMSWTDLTKAPYNMDGDYHTYDDGDVPVILQPATAHLALDENEDPTKLFDPAITNVAKYIKSDDGVRISSVSKYATNTQGERLYYATWNEGSIAKGDKVTAAEWKDHYGNADDIEDRAVYAVDYVNLTTRDAEGNVDIADIKADQWKWPTADTEKTPEIYAVHDTEFYIVRRSAEGKGILHFVDYENLPAIKNADSTIRAVYAVAENTTANSSENDYWVANVIVIEVENYVGDYDSISMFTRNSSQTSGSTKRMETLNNETGPVVDVIPSEYDWNTEILVGGFFKLYDTKKNDDGSLTADDVDRIDADYNDNHIFAGTIHAMNKVNQRGGYIVVDNGKTNVNVDTYNIPVYVVDGKTIKEATLDDEARYSDVEKGDEIIWVENAKDNVAFIVDVKDARETSRVKWKTPQWLLNEYDAIMVEQSYIAPSSDLEIASMTIKGEPVTFSKGVGSVTLTNGQATNTTDLENWAVTSKPAGAKVSVVGANDNLVTGTAKTNLVTDAIGGNNTTRTFTWTVTLRSGDKTVSYPVNVTISAARDVHTLTSLKIKGVAVDLTGYTGTAFTSPTTATISVADNKSDAAHVEWEPADEGIQVSVSQARSSGLTIGGTGALNEGNYTSSGSEIEITVKSENNSGSHTITIPVTVTADTAKLDIDEADHTNHNLRVGTAEDGADYVLEVPARTRVGASLLDVTPGSGLKNVDYDIDGDMITVSATVTATGETVEKTVKVEFGEEKYYAYVHVGSTKGNVQIVLRAASNIASEDSGVGIYRNGAYIKADDLKRLGITPGDITVKIDGVKYTGATFANLVVDPDDSTKDKTGGIYDCDSYLPGPGNAFQSAGAGFIKINVGETFPDSWVYGDTTAGNDTITNFSIEISGIELDDYDGYIKTTP